MIGYLHRSTARFLAGLLPCTLCLAAHAATPAALTPGQMAISGYWHSLGRFDLGKVAPDTPAIDTLLPKQQKWSAAVHAKSYAALVVGKYEPTTFMQCYPAEIPGTGFPPSPYETAILVEPRAVTFLNEVNRAIRIAYVGQQHPAGLKPSWQGDSVAHWEGDTLVVDTIGLSDRNDADLEAGVRIPITTKMHVIQRLRVVDGKLQNQATFDDPGAFTGPYTVTTPYARAKPFQEFICAENNHEGGTPTADGRQTAYTVGQTH